MIFSLKQRFDLRWQAIFLCGILAFFYAAVIGWQVSLAAALAAFWLMFAMALVTLIDMRHFIIPDILSIPAIPVGIAASLVLSGWPWEDILFDRLTAVLVAGLSLWALRLVYYKARGMVGLGLGDVKLGAAAGAWIGLTMLPWTLLLASMAALAAVLVQSRLGPSRTLSATTKVPFGSFIAPSILIVWTWNLFQI